MQKKILSVAIATYNMEQYLEACLKSITLPDILNDIEVLIINDGSTDNSLKIAYRYEAEYPETVRVLNKKNGGYGSAINMGIDNAKGKYFKTLDADDWFDCNSFRIYLNQIKRVDVDLIITHYSEESEKTGISRPVYYMGVEYDKICDFTKFCIRETTGYHGFLMHAMTYRTDILRMGDFRMSNCYYSDMDYAVYPLVNVKSIMFIDQVLYKYRIGRDNQSVSDSGLLRHFDDHIFICRKLVNYYTEHQARNDTIISLNIGYNTWGLVAYNISVIMGILRKADGKRSKKELQSLLSFLREKDHDLYILAYQKVETHKIFKRKELLKKLVGV